METKTNKNEDLKSKQMLEKKYKIFCILALVSAPDALSRGFIETPNIGILGLLISKLLGPILGNFGVSIGVIFSSISSLYIVYLGLTIYYWRKLKKISQQ